MCLYYKVGYHCSLNSVTYVDPIVLYCVLRAHVKCQHFLTLLLQKLHRVKPDQISQHQGHLHHTILPQRVSLWTLKVCHF